MIFASIILIVILFIFIYKKRDKDQKEDIDENANVIGGPGSEGNGDGEGDGDGEGHTLVTDNPLNRPKYEKSYSGIWSTFIKGLGTGKKTDKSKTSEKEEMLDSQSSPMKT